MEKMRAAVFERKGSIQLREVPRPKPGPGEALLRVTLTTICGTDVHILKGEYPVKQGLIIGHEPVGVIEQLGDGVVGYEIGDRVIAGAITPCGQCRACLSGAPSQCGHMGDGYEAIGGWRFGNTINGCQAEYVLVPNAQANLAKIPAALSDEEVLLCPDIMSTGFSASERGHVKLGDSVVVFAQGPIGLCATAGARMSGASLAIGVDRVHARLEMALRSVHAGGTVSSRGVYAGHLSIPLDAMAAGLGDHTVVTTLCPGGKERMRRLMSIVAAKRAPFEALVTHSFSL